MAELRIPDFETLDSGGRHLATKPAINDLLVYVNGEFSVLRNGRPLRCRIKSPGGVNVVEGFRMDLIASPEETARIFAAQFGLMPQETSMHFSWKLLAPQPVRRASSEQEKQLQDLLKRKRHMMFLP